MNDWRPRRCRRTLRHLQVLARLCASSDDVPTRALVVEIGKSGAYPILKRLAEEKLVRETGRGARGLRTWGITLEGIDALYAVIGSRLRWPVRDLLQAVRKARQISAKLRTWGWNHAIIRRLLRYRTLPMIERQILVAEEARTPGAFLYATALRPDREEVRIDAWLSRVVGDDFEKVKFQRAIQWHGLRFHEARYFVNLLRKRGIVPFEPCSSLVEGIVERVKSGSKWRRKERFAAFAEKRRKLGGVGNAAGIASAV